jgi:hypothetical protein
MLTEKKSDVQPDRGLPDDQLTNLLKFPFIALRLWLDNEKS